MAKDQKINLKFILTDGSSQTVTFTIPTGQDGKDGTDGKDGKDGNGIVSVSVTQEDVE